MECGEREAVTAGGASFMSQLAFIVGCFAVMDIPIRRSDDPH